jgi:outer membrane protein
MNRRIIVFFLCILVLAGRGLFADTINLEQVRALALANSRSLAKYNLVIQGTVLDERSRVYSTLPSVSLGASASMNLWSAQNAAPIGNPFDTFGAGASVSVSQRIFEGGKTLVQKAINELASESAKKDALAEYFNVLDSADNAYYAVLEAEATLEAAESSLQTALASLSIAEIRQASGMINQGDYLKALAEKEARESARNQARRNLALSATKLKSIIGLSALPQPEQIDFSSYDTLINYLGNISDEEGDILYGEFRDLFFVANPSLAKAGIANQRAEKNLDLAKRSYSPSLSASFSTGLNYTPNSGIERSGGRLSLSASIPIDFWVISNNVEKSRIARDSAVLDYISAEIQLETEMQSSLLNAFAEAGSVLSSRRSLEYAEKHFEYVMERYRLSQASVSDLGDASALLITSRNNLIKAQYGFLQSLSKLRSLGAIDDEEKLVQLLLRNN